MCGIAGAIWTAPETALTESQLRQMTDQLRHRGPDDEGIYRSDFQHQTARGTEPGVGLGFRRLAIIDLQTGNQPLCNEDQSVWVVFNGEIYNYPELRKRLEGSGHQFKTRSDTEVIVHLYEDEGPEVFSHLNGMFAIAIWDAKRRELILGRDRLGQKPLVYSQQEGRLAFASELKSLLAVPGISKEIDLNAIDDYLAYQYIPHPYTIFKGIKKLPPGHRAIWRPEGLVVEPYWKPAWGIQKEWTYEAAKEELHRLLSSAVELRMQADVPLGAFLSGGIDSSLVVALMQRYADEPIKTFSIGFDQKEYDETRYAQQVATHLGTQHHEFRVTPDAVKILPKLIWHYDEPFADSSAIPTWYVSQMTREHVTVALSGDGGDELFAGYQRYQAIRLGQWIDQLGPLKKILGSKSWQKLPASPRQKGLVRRWKRFTSAVAKDPVARYMDWIAIFNEQRRGHLYRPEFVEALHDADPLAFLSSAWARMGARDPVSCASLADLQTYLPCDLMTKTDIASMANSLECRQPFLDFRLVEFAIGLPPRFKLRGSAGKRILKETFGHLLPPEIWQRRKMGFGVPLDHWFRNELNGLAWDTLGSETAGIHQWFQAEEIRQLLKSHSEGSFDHSYRLWSLLVLELWLKQWGSC
jgi:asparagine synthase (glutamine-hydrolysing)